MLKNIIYHIKELTKLNLEYLKNQRGNYKYQKRPNVIFDEKLLNQIRNDYEPVFVLSTGRCGTEYLTRILEQSDQTKVYHSPQPELLLASKYAYENNETDQEQLKKILDAARIELILNAYLRNQCFIETNNKITFFAYAISDLFPKSKFIHLVRHPGSFVRSGLNRNWYTNSSNHDLGRIVPNSAEIDFAGFNEIQKISWLWNETNLFIEKFKSDYLESTRIITVKSENLFGNIASIKSIFDFIGCEQPLKNRLNKIINEKINSQKKSSHPNYSEWSMADKNQLKSICTLAPKYDYRLAD
jgi:hypothetical protein